MNLLTWNQRPREEASLFNPALSISEDGGLVRGVKPPIVSKKFEDSITTDARECLGSARMLGRWLAKAGATSTIMAAWGIRP